MSWDFRSRCPQGHDVAGSRATFRAFLQNEAKPVHRDFCKTNPFAIRPQNHSAFATARTRACGGHFCKTKPNVHRDFCKTNQPMAARAGAGLQNQAKRGLCNDLNGRRAAADVPSQAWHRLAGPGATGAHFCKTNPRAIRQPDRRPRPAAGAPPKGIFAKRSQSRIVQ